MSEEKKLPSDAAVHSLLPYVVRLRRMECDDALSSTHEWRGEAYSLSEAAMQAILEIAGNMDTGETKYRIEKIGPDVPAYHKQLAQAALDAVMALGRAVRGATRPIGDRL